MVTEINYQTRIATFNPPPLAQVVPANPLRSRILLGSSVAAGGAWVWPDRTQSATGGIMVPTAPPYLLITEEEWGNLVKAEWVINAAFPGAVTLFILEGFTISTDWRSFHVPKFEHSADRSGAGVKRDMPTIRYPEWLNLPAYQRRSILNIIRGESTIR